MFISLCEPSLWSTDVVKRVFHVNTPDYQLSYTIYSRTPYDFSQLTAISFLNRISWLAVNVVLTNAGVGTEPLYSIYIKFELQMI